MKEAFRPTRLTNGDRSPYALLGAPIERGIIFMVDATSTGETARGVGTPKPPEASKPLGRREHPAAKTPETIVPKATPRISAGEAWKRVAGSRELTADEQWMVEKGIYPIAGGAVQAQHETDILATALGSPEELREVEKLIYGDEQHIFRPADLPGIIDAGLRNRIATRLPEVVGRIVEEIPSGEHIPDHLFQWIVDSPGQARPYQYAEQFLTRVLLAPFNSPTTQYQLEGFYVGTNVDTIIRLVEVREEQRLAGEPLEVRRRENKGIKMRILKTAIADYHEMNRVINSGQIDQYAQISPMFSPELFEVVQKIPGVGQTKRLFEQAQSALLARDGAIDNTNFPQMREQVAKLLVELNNRTNIFTEGAGPNGRLADWELKRAIDLAETMMTIEFRTAEKMSMGKISRVNDTASPPQESARRLLDWFRELGLKFSIDEVQGGVNLMKRTKEKFRTLVERKYPWLNAGTSMRLKTLNKIDVTDFEMAGLFGVHGVWDGYRVNIGSLDRIILDDFNDATTGQHMERSVWDYLDKLELVKVVGTDRARDIVRRLADSNDILTGKRRSQFKDSITAKEDSSHSHKGQRKGIEEIKVKDILDAAKKVTDGKRLEEMNQILEEVMRPLVDRTTLGLGALLSAGGIYHPNLYHVREMIWKKVVEYDPLVVAMQLSGLKFKGDVDENARSLKNILQGHGLTGINDNRWEELRTKLILAHEKRMKASMGIEINASEERPHRGRINNRVALVLDPQEFTPTELQIIQDIKDKGGEIAKDLALVRFPYTVFLDDLPFEDASYKEMGPEFFRRRTGSDLPAFVQAQKAWVTLIGKAGTLKAEKRLEQFEAIVDGTADVMGADWAQDYITDALFEADCEFISQYPWAQQFIIDGIARWTGKPTSQAQEYGGTSAEALNNYQMAEYLNGALHHGILRKEGQGKIQIGDQIILETWDGNYEDFRKRRGATLLHALIALIRDIFIGSLFTGSLKLGEETIKAK